MTKTIVAMFGLGILLAGATGADAAEASVSVDVASAYVFRGATFNDGAVLQPGLEVSGLPIDLGVWGNLDLDDYDGAVEDGQFSEIDIYGSYSLPIESEDVEVSVGYTEYVYPSAGGDADREVSLSAGLALPLAPSVTASYGVDGGIDKDLYVEAGVSHGVEVSEDLSVEGGATMAFLDDDDGESGLSNFTVSLSATYKFLTAGVTYVGRIDDDVLADVEDGGAYDTEVYGTIGISHAF